MLKGNIKWEVYINDELWRHKQKMTETVKSIFCVQCWYIADMTSSIILATIRIRHICIISERFGKGPSHSQLTTTPKHFEIDLCILTLVVELIIWPLFLCMLWYPWLIGIVNSFVLIDFVTRMIFAFEQNLCLRWRRCALCLYQESAATSARL